MTKKNNKVNLPSAMVAFTNRLKAFLECDDEIKVDFNYDRKTMTITISNAIKASAWRQILPETKLIGSDEIMYINIECDKEGVDENILIAAMTGNKTFSRYFHEYIPEQGIDRNFCYMNPSIIQFLNDNFGSPESLETRTAEDLAKEVLDIPLLNFCTEPIDK